MQIAIVFADFLWRAGVGYKIGNDAHMFEGFIWGGWRGQVTRLTGNGKAHHTFLSFDAKPKPAGRCEHRSLQIISSVCNNRQNSTPAEWGHPALQPLLLFSTYFTTSTLPPKFLWQHRTIPALRLKHRSGSCGTASTLPKCSIMSGCGTRIVLRGQKPLALCDRCPCFGSLFPPLAALTFAASSIICAFGLASLPHLARRIGT